MGCGKCSNCCGIKDISHIIEDNVVQGIRWVDCDGGEHEFRVSGNATGDGNNTTEVNNTPFTNGTPAPEQPQTVGDTPGDSRTLIHPNGISYWVWDGATWSLEGFASTNAVLQKVGDDEITANAGADMVNIKCKSSATINTDTTYTNADVPDTVFVDASGGAVAVTLPDDVCKIVNVKMLGNPNGSSVTNDVDGLGSYVFYSPKESISLQSNGTNLYRID